MIVKVCGIKNEENHDQLSQLEIDMIGINFYEPSSRFIGRNQLRVKINQLRVGVFVQATSEDITQSVANHHLNYAQLHGDEDVSFCQKIKEIIPIIKVFRIEPDFNWDQIKAFDFCDYFLFDTHTRLYGGSGKKFDWQQLKAYTLDIPFLLSGGIGPGDAYSIKRIKHPRCKGVDINSKFEISPGIKDVSAIKKFIEELRN